MKNIAIATAALGLLAACASTPEGGATASAHLSPASGSKVQGHINFTQVGPNRVRVSGEVTGHQPGMKGFHIHEKGDCSAPDAMSAGGHFNPAGKPHGDPATPDHHGGDMPMLTADAAGNATLEATIDTVTIGSGAGDIVGRAVVIHKDPDDFKTQPTGNSGARVACGVIARS